MSDSLLRILGMAVALWLAGKVNDRRVFAVAITAISVVWLWIGIVLGGFIP